MNLQTVLQFLLKPKGKPWGDSGQPMPLPGEPEDAALRPAVPSSPAPQTPGLVGFKYSTPEERAAAQANVDEGLAKTQATPPAMRKGTATRDDALGAGLAALLGGKNPAFLAAALRRPQENADQQAQLDNTNAQNAYQAQLKAGETQLNAGIRQIGLLQSHDEVAARIESTIKINQIKENTKLFIAEAKSDQVLMTAIAKVLENGGSLPAIQTLLEQKNDQMGISEDPDVTRAKAEGLYQAAQTDPSMKNKLQSASIQAKNNAAAETAKQNHRKTLLSPNATYEDKLNAIMALGDAGDPRFGQMTFDQMQSAAMAKGSVTQKNEAQTNQITELLPYRIQEFKDKHGLSQARSENIAKKTSLMDEESAVKVARGYATIDNLRSQIGDREKDRALGYAKLNTDQLIRSQDGLKTSLTTIATQTNTLRGRLTAQLKALSMAEDDEEKKRIEADIAGIEASIKDYKSMYGETLQELEKIRGALGSVAQPSESGDPGETPVTPDLSGAVNGGAGGPTPAKPTPRGAPPNKKIKKGQTKTFNGGVKVTRIS